MQSQMDIDWDPVDATTESADDPKDELIPPIYWLMAVIFLSIGWFFSLVSTVFAVLNIFWSFEEPMLG